MFPLAALRACHWTSLRCMDLTGEEKRETLLRWVSNGGGWCPFQIQHAFNNFQISKWICSWTGFSSSFDHFYKTSNSWDEMRLVSQHMVCKTAHVHIKDKDPFVFEGELVTSPPQCESPKQTRKHIPQTSLNQHETWQHSRPQNTNISSSKLSDKMREYNLVNRSQPLVKIPYSQNCMLTLSTQVFVDFYAYLNSLFPNNNLSQNITSSPTTNMSQISINIPHLLNKHHLEFKHSLHWYT